MSAIYIALLRGINVGGKNKIPMEGLRGCFAEAGCSDIRTYIQSGNVVFRADDFEAAKATCGQVEAAILELFGCKSPIVLRSEVELRSAAQNNPFLSEHGQNNTDSLHVVFLANEPEPLTAASLDPERSPGDEFRLIGREIYLRLPRGVAETKFLIPYFDSKLKTIGTSATGARSWR